MKVKVKKQSGTWTGTDVKKRVNQLTINAAYIGVIKIIGQRKASYLVD